MDKIRNASERILSVISDYNEKGISFLYKGIDLTDVLFGELVANEINKKHKPQSLSGKIKHYLKYPSRIKKPDVKKATIGKSILIFVNTFNQWSNIYPVFTKLNDLEANLIVITTKSELASFFLSKDIGHLFIKGSSFRLGDFFKRKTGLELTLVLDYLPQIRFLEGSFSQIISSFKPDYILIGNDNTYEGRLIATIAKKLEIATGIVQHGAIDRINPLFGRSVVDHIFVYGEKARTELVYLGIENTKIIISGWPQKDLHFQKLANSAKLNYFSGGFFVTALSGHGHSVSKAHHLEIIKCLIKLQADLGVDICVKLHPKDDSVYYKDLDPKHTIILNNDDLAQRGIFFHQLLAQASVVITGAGTSVLDSLLVGTPVVSVDLCNEYSDVSFIKNGLTRHATDYVTLKNMIVKVLDANDKDPLKQREHEVEEYFYKFYDTEYSASTYIASYINSFKSK